MALKTYRQKRNFEKTAEPRGKVSKTRGQLFVVQKHAASHLHYDFRLELQGVLKSWAVPKGPCLDPKVKRLAIAVEDHPIEYGEFEGIIPKGEYGGGTVMLWDKGRWFSLDEDAEAAYEKGHLHFYLQGKKLKGQWDLIRFKENQWFLIKYTDEYAKPLADYDITEQQPLSAKSQLNLEEIANHSNKLWHSNEERTKPRDVGLSVKYQQTLTNAGKILYAEDNITKEELFDYYDQISAHMLPYIRNRALTLVRCPSNYQKCFYQKHLNNASLPGLYSVDVESKNDHSIEQGIYIKDKKGLKSLAQMAVLEIHPWGSTVKQLDNPDILIFDLDPGPEVSWKMLVQAAKEIKKELEDLQLRSFIKTTGGKGLHVVIPIKAKYNWDIIKNFTHVFAEFLERKQPDIYVSNMAKAKRKGKIFIDYLRNQWQATAVGPFSPRARPHAPVATPLHWDELTTNSEDTYYTIRTIHQRLAHLREDPWHDFWQIKQSLPLDKLE